MKVFYATFGVGHILGKHILKVYANDEYEARKILDEAKLLQTCVAFIYDEVEGLRIIEKWGNIVIDGRVV